MRHSCLFASRSRCARIGAALSALSSGCAPSATEPASSPESAERPPTASDGLALTPPMGFNDWNAFGCNVSEQLMRETAAFFVSSGLKDAGYSYVNIDDCWALRERGADGKLVADPAKFPSGIQAVADYVHGLGLKLGIYADAGTLTCAGYPGSLGVEDLDAQTVQRARLPAGHQHGPGADQRHLGVPQGWHVRHRSGAGRVRFSSWPQQSKWARRVTYADVFVSRRDCTPPPRAAVAPARQMLRLLARLLGLPAVDSPTEVAVSYVTMRLAAFPRVVVPGVTLCAGRLSPWQSNFAC